MDNIVSPPVTVTPAAPAAPAATSLNPGAIDYSWLQGDKPTQNLVAPMASAGTAPMGMAQFNPYGMATAHGGGGEGPDGTSGIGNEGSPSAATAAGVAADAAAAASGNDGTTGVWSGGGLVSAYRRGGPVRPPYREEARQVAAQGRGPDTMLIHVTPKELRGLASLHPSGQLPRNPQTGLPEAGFFENVLPGILGTVFGSFVGMPWLGAVIGGVGTGLATGDMGKGLLSGLMSFGLGSAFSGLAEAGAAGAGITSTEAAKASIVPEALSGGSPTLGGAGALQAGNEAARNAFESVGLGINAMGSGPIPPVGANLGSIIRNQSINPNMGFLERAAQGISNIPDKLSNIPTTLSNIGTGLSDPKALMANALPALTGLSSGYGLYQASQPPPPPWTPAIPQQSTGPTQPAPTNLRTPTNYAPTANYGRGPEATFFTPNPGFPYMAAGGHIKALATGGVIPRGYDSYEMARGGIASMPSGMIRGPGAGMDDAIPGTIDGRRDVRLSDGEYVLSADVVSGIGDGSSAAGARRLAKMVENIREKKYGRSKQPGKLAGGLASLGMLGGGKVKEEVRTALLGERTALLGERLEDALGNTYESIGSERPPDFNVEDYGGRFPTYDSKDGKMNINLRGKKYFRTIPPGTLRKYPGPGGRPLEWMRRIEGFPTS